MLNLDSKRVYLAVGGTDMRKNINGLAAIVEGSFNLNLFDGALFIFYNRNRDRIKILELLRYRNNSNYSDINLVPMHTIFIVKIPCACREILNINKKHRYKYLKPI